MDDTYESLKQELQQVDCVMENESENFVKRFMGVGGQPKEVIQSLSEGYRGYPQMINLLQRWATVAGMDEEQVHNQIADSIFTQAQAPPVWLEDIVNQKEWRELIYSLSEEHKKCLMLSFAVQRIAEAGHHEEIGSLSTACQHFKVFTGIVEVALTKLLQVHAKDFDEELPHFQKLACNSSHTLMYTQCLLSQLISQTSDECASQRDRAQRISQELDIYMQTKVTPNQKLWLKIKHTINPPPNNLVLALESIIQANSTNPGDMTRIFDLYTRSNPPNVQFIQNPTLINLLVIDLFTTQTNVQQTYLRKYAVVLAHATSRNESDSAEANKSRMDRTLKAIQDVSKLCKEYKVSSSHYIQQGKQFEQYLDVNIACCGILKHIGACLHDPNYYSSPSVNITTPILFYLLRQIIVKQPFQREAVFHLLKICFDMNPSIDALAALEVKKNLLQHLLFLTYHGFVFPVFRQMNIWCHSIDHSLIRFFVTTFLENTSGPYTQSIYELIVQLVSLPASREALSRNPNTIIDFLKNAGNPDHLSDNVQSLIQQLSTSEGNVETL